MQAVILAAGRGTRMGELTSAVPKPMLDLNGRPLLEYKLDALPEEVREVIIVIGYHGETIRNRFGNSFHDRKITYIEQEELNGTAGALWKAKDILKDRFLIMAGDDIYMREDVERCLEGGNWKMLVQELPEMHRAGRVELDVENNVDRITESSEEDEMRREPGLASTSLFVVDTRLFTCPMIPKHKGNLEFGHPQTIVAAAQQLGVPLEPVFTDQWIQITAPNDLTRAEEILKERAKETAG